MSTSIKLQQEPPVAAVDMFAPNEPRWIKTGASAMLPRVLEDVLVVVHVDSMEDMVDMAFWDGTAWRVSGFPDWKIDPLAWMSIPKPPDDL